MVTSRGGGSAPRKRFPNAARCRLRRLCCPSVRVGRKLWAWRDAEAPSVSGNDHSLVPCGVGIAGRLQQVAPLPGVRERHSRDIGACEEQLFIAPVAFATTTRRASMGVPRSFPFVPGVYQRQSIVVDLGATAPRAAIDLGPFSRIADDVRCPRHPSGQDLSLRNAHARVRHLSAPRI